MSYTYLLAAGEESSAESFSDINPAARWKSSPTLARFYCNASAMDNYHPSPSGMTCEPSTVSHGGESLTSCVVASPVRTSALSGEVPDSTGSEADYGEKCGAWFAKFSPGLCSWKTPQRSLFEDWGEFSVTWPRWGLMLRGECSQLAPLVRHIHVKGCGFWPTPRKANIWEHKTRPSGGGGCRNLGWELGGLPNPTWAEWLMGWPMTWTGLQPLETAKFQAWLEAHGLPSQPV